MAKLKPGPGKVARQKRYKDENRRAVNKAKKAKRHEKRMKRFADRKAAGKCYEYNKEHTEKKRNDRIPIGSNLNSNRGRHTEFARQDSVDSYLARCYAIQQKEAAKRFAAKKKHDSEDDN